MCVIKRLGHFEHYIGAPFPIEPTIAQPSLERAAGKQVHHHVEQAVGLVDIVDANDVGMVETGDRATLALEAGAEAWILIDGRRQDLDRNRPIELRMMRAVDRRHATFTETGLECIFTKSAPD